MLHAFRQRDHAVARRRGSQQRKFAEARRKSPKGADRGRGRELLRWLLHTLPSDCLGARVGAFDDTKICWCKVQHGRRIAVLKTPGGFKESIRRNGDLAGAKTRAR